MGVLQINQQTILIGLGVVAFIAICIVGIFASNQQRQINGEESTTYVNNLTGEESVIFPDKGVELGATAPEVEIAGIEKVYDRYRDYQATSIASQIREYVDGVSAGRASYAALVNAEIVKKDDKTDIMRIFINRPEATFEVTVTTENAAQQTPSVTFRKEQ